jgi:hypothetical protein
VAPALRFSSPVRCRFPLFRSPRFISRSVPQAARIRSTRPLIFPLVGRFQGLAADFLSPHFVFRRRFFVFQLGRHRVRTVFLPEGIGLLGPDLAQASGSLLYSSFFGLRGFILCGAWLRSRAHLIAGSQFFCASARGIRFFFATSCS